MKEQVRDIIRRFTYHKVTGSPVEDMKTLRINARNLALIIIDTVPPGREQSLALTKLEESTMWANAGIARTKGEMQE